MLEARFATTLGSFHLEAELQAETGTTTVLLGGSGSGKSTVLRLLAGLLQPDDGYFALDGELYVDTSKRFKTTTQARPIGYVFQEYVLFPHLSVFDNVAFGLKMEGASSELIGERVNEALENAHLVGYDDRKPGQLSGGQQQRVAMARALALQPRLLLLDESLSALDIQTRREVQQELKTILEELKLTTVMVSHQYQDALIFGDQIMVLDQGEVIQRGKHLDLLSRPASRYVAEMVGVNYFNGRAARASDGEYVVALDRASEDLRVTARADPTAPLAPSLAPQNVSVVIDPRNVALHAARPEDTRTNVFRGEIVQVLPVSAAYSPTGGIEGLMRVAVKIDDAIPPLRCDLTVGVEAPLSLAIGSEVFASFAVGETRIYP